MGTKSNTPIGKPIDQPAIAAAQVVMNKGSVYDKTIQNRVNEVIDAELPNIENFCEKLTCGKISVWKKARPQFSFLLFLFCYC